MSRRKQYGFNLPQEILKDLTFYKAKFSISRGPTLVDLCIQEVVKHPSLCQEVHLQLPHTLLLALLRAALALRHNRVVSLILKSWPHADLAIREILPQLFCNSSMLQRSFGISRVSEEIGLAFDCTNLVLDSLKSGALPALKHVDFTGIPAFTPIEEGCRNQFTYYYADVIEKLRGKGLTITHDINSATNAYTMTHPYGVFISRNSHSWFPNPDQLNLQLITRLCLADLVTAITRDILDILEQLVNLEEFNLHNILPVEVSIEEIYAVLAKLTQLKRLTLKMQISSLHRSTLANLEYLNIAETRLSSEDIECLKNCDKLVHLNVSECHVDNEGWEAFWNTLPKLKALEALEIWEETRLLSTRSFHRSSLHEQEAGFLLENLGKCRNLKAFGMDYYIPFARMQQLNLIWFAVGRNPRHHHGSNCAFKKMGDYFVKVDEEWGKAAVKLEYLPSPPKELRPGYDQFSLNELLGVYNLEDLASFRKKKNLEDLGDVVHIGPEDFQNMAQGNFPINFVP